MIVMNIISVSQLVILICSSHWAGAKALPAFLFGGCDTEGVVQRVLLSKYHSQFAVDKSKNMCVCACMPGGVWSQG